MPSRRIDWRALSSTVGIAVGALAGSAAGVLVLEKRVGVQDASTLSRSEVSCRKGVLRSRCWSKLGAAGSTNSRARLTRNAALWAEPGRQLRSRGPRLVKAIGRRRNGWGSLFSLLSLRGSRAADRQRVGGRCLVVAPGPPSRGVLHR
jgi:hypothetical protein